MFTELSLSAQTLYAQVNDAASAIELSRSVADLNGSFAKRTIKGADYWYFQHRDVTGAVRLHYVGRDSDKLRGLIARANRPSARPQITELARAALDLGCASVLRKHLSESFFSLSDFSSSFWRTSSRARCSAKTAR
jgi:hypothetical protein